MLPAYLNLSLCYQDIAKIFKRDRREFEVFQIEVSSYSSLECKICPRAVFAEKWLFQNMTLETYQKIARNFPQARWVIFQGWGDPLENENFPAMFQMARQAECRTGLMHPGVLSHPGNIRGSWWRKSSSSITLNLEEIPPADGEGPADESRAQPNPGPDSASHPAEEEPKPGEAAVKLSFLMTRLNMSSLRQVIPAAANWARTKSS